MNRLRIFLPVALVSVGVATWLIVRAVGAPEPTDPLPPDPVRVTPPEPTLAMLLPLVPAFAPPDAEAVAVVRSARSLLTGLGVADLGASPHGADMAAMLVAQLGFDASSPTALAELGLDPDRPIGMAARADGLMVLTVQATNPERLDEQIIAMTGLGEGPRKPFEFGELRGAVFDEGGLAPMALLRDGERLVLIALPPGETPAQVLGAIAGGADAWKERLAPMQGQEPESALVLMWTAAMDNEEALELGRTGDPVTDAMIELAERFGSTPAFYLEGDSLVAVSAPGAGLRLDTYSRVSNEEQARALLGGACRVDSLVASLGDRNTVRGAGVMREQEIALLSRVVDALPLPAAAATMGKLRAAFAESGLGEAMWEAPGRLRCVGVSAATNLDEILLAVEVGEGPEVAAGVGTLLTGVVSAMAPELPAPRRVPGARPAWEAPGGVRCDLLGPVLLCGGAPAVERAVKRLDDAPVEPRPNAVFRLEADLRRFAAMAIESFGGEGDAETLLRVLSALGTMKQSEELAPGGARMSLSFSGGDRPILRALLLP